MKGNVQEDMQGKIGPWSATCPNCSPHCIKTQFTFFFFTLLQSLQVYGSKNIYICEFGETLSFQYIIILLEQTATPKNFIRVKNIYML